MVACERSGIVRDALLAVGHDAISCDLKPTRKPGPHYEGDVRDILGDAWDGLIAHPVCKYMANSGVRWLHEREGRWDDLQKGIEFFNIFRDAAHIPQRAIENPILHKYAVAGIGRKADQYIQPWWFGDPFSKATGLWLYGLPKLKKEYKKSDYPEIKQEVWLMAPSEDREEKRSQTYPGIARAFAQYWFIPHREHSAPVQQNLPIGN